MPSADVLPAGLTILSALARLCLSDSASVLLRATLDILDDEETEGRPHSAGPPRHFVQKQPVQAELPDGL